MTVEIGMAGRSPGSVIATKIDTGPRRGRVRLYFLIKAGGYAFATLLFIFCSLSSIDVI